MRVLPLRFGFSLRAWRVWGIEIVLVRLYWTCPKSNRISRFLVCDRGLLMAHESFWTKFSEALRLAGLPASKIVSENSRGFSRLHPLLRPNKRQFPLFGIARWLAADRAAEFEFVIGAANGDEITHSLL